MEQYDSLFCLSRTAIETLKNDKNFLRLEASLKTMGSCGSVDCKYRECQIDQGWIIIIEEMLPYVEKAIGESRHFIKQYGEIVRIDQVRKVSSASVEHLSRHSNLLTKKENKKGKPQDEDEQPELVPEKLYVTEIADNYQLYENRFLYTLLVFLKDFVQTRYNAIISEISASFYEFSFTGDVASGNETYTFRLSMTEKDDNIRFDASDLACAEEILRINAILEIISSLLETSLMKSVAPLSTLSLPVTATNIIKKDPNFQMAYRLWDYILNYNEKGYEITEKHSILSPVSAGSCENVGLILSLLSLCAKAEGLDLYPSLAKKSEKNYLNAQTGNQEVDDLKARLLLEQEKSGDLTHTLEAITLLNDTAESYQKRIDELEEKLADLQKEYEFQKAENTALLIADGRFAAEDHTEEEDFLRLAREKEAFDQYYEQKYPVAKKKLRKKYIWDKFKEK